MNDWFSHISTGCTLPAKVVQELKDVGFAVIPGPVASEALAQFADTYDAAVASAASNDVKIGSSTTRIDDFVNRGPEFDPLYVFPAVLEACCQVIGQPFKLSTLLSRTVRPGSQAQALHVDFPRDSRGWPMLGFIFMIDDFRADNGATRFVPGSHHWSSIPVDITNDPQAEQKGEVVACGPAGSVIVYNGSVWHGHTANSADVPRRSIQGAYIRRDATAGLDLPARMRPETLARISPLAKYVLAI